MTSQEREPYRTYATTLMDFIHTHGPNPKGPTPEGKMRVRGYFRTKTKKESLPKTLTFHGIE